MSITKLRLGAVLFWLGASACERPRPVPASQIATTVGTAPTVASQAPNPGRATPAAPSSASGSAPEPSRDASLTVLAEALASKSYEDRMIAVEAIGDAGRGELVPWLERALGDPEHDVRVLSVEALGKLGTPAARAALATVRDDTTEALGIRALAAAQLLRRNR